MIVPVGNQQYFVRLAGAGEPVVLLHGFTGTAKQWENLVNQSDIFCQWIGIDMPGHGKTLIRDEKTMEGYVDELIEVINQLELNRFHLVGYSMGGRTAMLLADRYEPCQSLTLVGASPGLESEEERAERKRKTKNWLHLSKKKESSDLSTIGKISRSSKRKSLYRTTFKKRFEKNDSSKRSTDLRYRFKRWEPESCRLYGTV